jgi:hypothetical protein
MIILNVDSKSVFPGPYKTVLHVMIHHIIARPHDHLQECVCIYISICDSNK